MGSGGVVKARKVLDYVLPILFNIAIIKYQSKSLITLVDGSFRTTPTIA